MKAFIASNHEPTTVKVRQLLLGEGQDCPAGHVVTLDLAANQLGHLQPAPDLLIVVLSPDTQRALTVLAALRPLTQARVLVVGPASDPKIMLQALRAGAGDYIDEAELQIDLAAALKRLRTEMVGQIEPGRTVAVFAPSGGSGSSTLAVNVATVLAQEHKTALLFDMKLERGDLAPLLDLRPTHTLADLCQNAAHMDRSMFESSLARHKSGVHLLAPPHSFTDIALVTPEGVRQALTLARALFPYVVVDLDNCVREEQTQILRQADIILLVLRLDFTCVRNAQRVLEHFDLLGIARDRIRLVVNRYGQPKEVPAAKAEEALNMKISHYVPDDPRTVNVANNNGVPAVLEAPRSSVSRSVTKLAASINGRHKAR
jgi:pilus assembly protein CpaE